MMLVVTLIVIILWVFCLGIEGDDTERQQDESDTETHQDDTKGKVRGGGKERAYFPSSWQEIETEWNSFVAAKEGQTGLGVRRYCHLNNTKFSPAALGKWGKWLDAMEAAGASIADLDSGMFSVTPRGLLQWQRASQP